MKILFPNLLPKPNSLIQNPKINPLKIIIKYLVFLKKFNKFMKKRNPSIKRKSSLYKVN